jgi:hypothetical protein
MSDTFELFLPCEVLNVNVVLAPSEKVTEVEGFILRALNEIGIDTLEALVKMFGLGHRPTLDLVLGLWRQGYIEVSEPGSILSLSPIAREYVQQRSLPEDQKSVLSLPGATESLARPEQIMRELITGHFIEKLPKASAVTPARVAPAIQSSEVLSESDRSEIFRVLMVRLRRTFSGRVNRLIAAYMPLKALETAAVSDSRLVRVLARVGKDLNSQQLLFDIVYPTQIPLLVRRDIGARLASLSCERPDDIFFRQLEESTQKIAHSEMNLEDAIAHLETKIPALKSVESGNARRIHEECRSLAESIEAMLAELSVSKVETEAVAGANAIIDAILGAIEKTERQLILVCPFLNVRGYQRVRDALASLLETKPVDVFLLWGMEEESKLTDPVQIAFSTLEKNARVGRFHFVELPARTHAKVILRDIDWALVGSFNYLSGLDDFATAELGLIIRMLEGRPCQQLSALARWARAVFPDYAVGRQIRTEPSEFDAEEFPNQTPNIRWPGEPLGTGSQEGLASLELWRNACLECIQELQRDVEGKNLKTARLRVVENENHRVWLWRALTTCRKRLFIASDRLSEDVVDERFLYAVRKLLETRDGPQITFLFNRSRTLTLLENLAQQFPERLNVIQAPNHAKLLAWDDHALVSSFNFLSFDGVYKGPLKRRIRSEIGILIEGNEVYASTVGAIAKQLPEVGADQRRNLLPSSLGALDQSAQRPASTNELLRLLESLQEIEEAGQRGIAIQDCFNAFPRASEAWDALVRMSKTQITSDDLELCAAAALLRPDARSHPELWARWLRWMAAKAWQEDRRFHAAILLAALPKSNQGNGVPVLEVAELAAVLGDPEEADSRFTALAHDSLTPTDRECLAILSAIAIVRSGSPSGGTALFHSRDAAEPRLREWLNALYEFWEQNGIGLPLSEMRELLDDQEAVAYAGEAKQNLRDSLDAATKREIDFGVGRLTWAELFGTGKIMQPLMASCDENDAKAAAKWLKDTGEGDQRIAKLMDRASENGTKGTKHHGEYIDGSRRRVYLGLLRNIFRAARDWVDAQPRSDFDDSHLVQETMRLGRMLRAHYSGIQALQAERTGTRHPSTPLLAELTGVLKPILLVENDGEMKRSQ